MLLKTPKILKGICNSQPVLSSVLNFSLIAGLELQTKLLKDNDINAGPVVKRVDFSLSKYNDYKDFSNQKLPQPQAEF